MNNVEKAKKLSEKKLKELQKELATSFNKEDFNKFFLSNICIYACGSLARYELVEDSDLDLFFINNSNLDITNIDKYRFFSRLYDINNKCKFKAPSKHGKFWDFISKKNLLDIGSQIEDYNNSLTARLLLILESKPIFNKKLYNKIVREVVSRYFVDYEGREQNFAPMFLINDILRYWYTLALNYEYRRDSNDPPNDKYWKQLKLKYARLLTCFSFIACLFEKNITLDKVIEIIKKTPFERLDYLVINNQDLADIVSDIKRKYDWFLSLKKEQSFWWDDKNNKNSAIKNAEEFHNAVIHTFMNKIYQSNLKLKNKLDF